MKNRITKTTAAEGVIHRNIRSLNLVMKSSSVLLLALCTMSAFFSAATLAQGKEGTGEVKKTDIVYLVNGDRISGEITRLQDGVIYITTELAGDVQMLWENVERLEGGTPLVFTLLDETVYRGSLGKESSESAALTVNTAEGSIPLNPSTLDVVGTTAKPPIDRFKGGANLGLTLLKTNETRQLSFGVYGSYTADSYYSEASYNSFYTSNDNSESTSKDYFSASYQRMLPRDWFFTGMFNAARNDGLNLDLRYNISGALGRDIIKNETVTLQALAGLGFVSESHEGLETDTGTEAVFGLKLKAFELESPRISITGEAMLYPKLTEFDRYRLETKVGLNMALAKNIFWGLSFFDSYYSTAPFPGAETNDYGVVSSLGISF